MPFAPLDSKIRAAIEERLRQGEKTPAIVIDLPVSASTVRRIAQEIGLKRRAGRPPTLDQQRRKVREMAGRGLSNSEIAYNTGLKESTVKRYLTDGNKKINNIA